jgi:7-carboxy-7-deazaguanine synthase
MDKTFRVLEIFGPTVQGEGRQAGTPSYFIRFAGCDLRCSWCDSPAAVLPELFTKEAQRMTSEEIVDKVKSLPAGPKWVVLTGGNPGLLQLGTLVERLHADNYKVMVETQGTLWKDWFYLADEICLSPKPPSSGNTVTALSFYNFLKARWTQNEEQYVNFFHKAYLKVVVFNYDDYEYAKDLHRKFPKFEFFLSSGTMTDTLPTISNPSPETNRYYDSLKETRLAIADQYRKVCEWVAHDDAMQNVKVLPQLHAIAWGDERGR